MTLEQWLQNGWLQKHTLTKPEITKRLMVVDRDIQDASVEAVSTDSRFINAYNAALQLCSIALLASGYTVSRGDSHHLRTIESIVLTLGSQHADTRDYLDRCRRQRSQGIYDQIDVVSSDDVSELLVTVQHLKKSVLEWLKIHHPVLLS